MNGDSLSDNPATVENHAEIVATERQFISRYTRPVVQEWQRRWYDQQFAPPPLVHHYTDASGLAGIVERHELWATHPAYLNDTRERLHGEEVIRHVLADAAASSTSSLAKFFADMAGKVTALNTIFGLPLDIYVACFCEADDLLSQWRGYGGAGGYAIGFDTDVLRFGIGPGTVLRKVLYRRAEQEATVRSLIEPFLGALSHMGNDLDQDPPPLDAPLEHWLPILMEEFWGAVFECFFCFKDEGFEEEREWRLICLKTGVHEDPNAFPTYRGAVSFRARGAMVTPYLKVPFPSPSKPLPPPFDDRMPITAVRVGPSPQPALAMQSVRMLLRAAHYPADRIVVNASAVPLRA